MPYSNVKYVMFSLITGSDKDRGKISATQSIENPTFFEIETLEKEMNKGGKSTTESLVITKLRDHVKKFGTITELTLTAHGDTEKITSGDGRKIYTDVFLKDIQKLEWELHTKITERIVFDGCSSFSNLKKDKIEFYKNFADTHDIEIVGLTSIEKAGSNLWGLINYRTGRYVQFSPQGEIVRDKLDTRFHPYALKEDDRTWVDNYLDAVSVKTYSTEPLNSDTKLLVEMAKEALGKAFNWSTSHRIDDNEREKLENADKLLKEAKIVIHKDSKGATIISSNGAIVDIGKESADMEVDIPKHTSYAHKMAYQYLNSDHKIASYEVQKLETLENILKDVKVIPTKDGKGFIIADTNGNSMKYFDKSIESNGKSSPKLSR